MAIRALFEAAPVGQLVLDQGRRIRAANPAAARIFGAVPPALVGREFSDLIAPESTGAVDRAFTAAGLEGAAPSRAVQGRTVGGGTFPLELIVLKLASGSSEGYGLIAHDMRPVAVQPTFPGATKGPPPAYTAAELLMANRLRELV